MQNRSTVILVSGAIAGGLGVALGAFGAHALKPLLLQNNAVDIYEVAARYQLYHSLALLVMGILAARSTEGKLFAWAAVCWLAGISLFSGSLYLLALTGTRAVVLLTPLGGVFFLAGWTLLVIALVRKKD